MTHFWFGASAYLLFSAIALAEAEIRAVPGASPGLSATVLAALRFALLYPARCAFHWVGARVERLMR
ncbi:hypothetical protein [Azospirillum sp. SYSU D00513]|uniref:hypothetical protein n=1 Tax=Azospirillum sp. SYSU D00513 TaxID=2812561 RepID=UPI001A95851B|nr:hypothetical protein [Azospirillum sp. SYSU D00513]